MNSITKYGFSQLIRIAFLMNQEPDVLRIFKEYKNNDEKLYFELKKCLKYLYSGEVLELIVLLIIFFNTKQDHNCNNIKLINILLKGVQ